MMMTLRRPIALKRIDDHGMVEDSGAETAESDCSKMSSPNSEEARRRQQKMMMMMVMNMHLLANPGDSLLLQQTLDRLLRWLCPSLRIFHVSERAAPLRHATARSASSRHCPFTGYPSLAVTFFLHEAYGEERILRVLDFLQRPPWQYHHTESCGGGAVPISSSSPADALLRPYLLPSRDFYRLGAGMPVWGVRPVHCGGEVLRVTLYSAHDNYEDSVRLYETVLQQQAEEQKAGFCWFTLHTEPGLCLQLAVKQLSPGVQVEPCSSAVLQFRVEEMGQLVPLLPNPCSPISASRWQTEDLDGNKILFQVKTPAQPPRPLTCAFPPTCPPSTSTSPRGLQPRGSGHAPATLGHTHSLAWTGGHRPGHRPRTDPGLEKPCALAGESLGSDSCCSSPPGSSCYSSQRSSPCPAPPPPPPPTRDSPLRHNISRSLSYLLLEEEDEEEEEEEPETNVDTGVPVSPRSDTAGVSAVATTTPRQRPASMDVSSSFPRSGQRPASMDVSSAFPRSEERPAAVGASALESLARELIQCLPAKHLTPPRPGAARTFWTAAGCKSVSSSAVEGCGDRTVAAGCKSVSSAMEGCGGRAVAAGCKSVSSAMEGGGGRTVAAGRSPSKVPLVERTLRAAPEPVAAQTLSARNTHNNDMDEFFI